MWSIVEAMVEAMVEGVWVFLMDGGVWGKEDFVWVIREVHSWFEDGMVVVVDIVMVSFLKLASEMEWEAMGVIGLGEVRFGMKSRGANAFQCMTFGYT